MDKLNEAIVKVLQTDYKRDIPAYAPSTRNYRIYVSSKLENIDLREEINDKIMRLLLQQKIVDVWAIAEKVMTDYCESFVKEYEKDKAERQKDAE